MSRSVAGCKTLKNQISPCFDKSTKWHIKNPSFKDEIWTAKDSERPVAAGHRLRWLMPRTISFRGNYFPGTHAGCGYSIPMRHENVRRLKPHILFIEL
jgi:hypothetical protein